MPAALAELKASAAAFEFSYHRSIAPTLGVLLALALLEALVCHVVAMALWGWGVALALGVLDLGIVGLLLALLRSLRAMPVTLDDDRLTMRLGWLKAVSIPLGHVAGLRTEWDAATLKRRDVVNLALASWPNVLITLSPPIRRGRFMVHAVAHKLDDPERFAATLARWTAAA
jgi:hypothetical protein